MISRPTSQLIYVPSSMSPRQHSAVSLSLNIKYSEIFVIRLMMLLTSAENLMILIDIIHLSLNCIINVYLSTAPLKFFSFPVLTAARVIHIRFSGLFNKVLTTNALFFVCSIPRI